MRFTHEFIEAKMREARRIWDVPVRIQITAGYGCTVLEIFERDVYGPSVPLRRILL